MVTRWRAIEQASKGNVSRKKKTHGFRVPSTTHLLIGFMLVVSLILYFQVDLNPSTGEHGLLQIRSSPVVEATETVQRDFCNECNPREPCPLVAITLATTSRTMAERIENPRKRKMEMGPSQFKRRPVETESASNTNSTGSFLATSSLFRIMLPSVVETAECKFDYLVVIGYDMGDRYYDSPESQNEVSLWFEENVAGPLSGKHIHISLAMVACNNTLRKPGPVFISATQEAYRLKADFIYRVNDDTQFITPWAKKLSDSVIAMGPPYGVAGPLVCNQGGNVRILTHDFTHRTHMDIFDHWYYPTELADWWMDAWISRVYGSTRTSLMQDVLVGHRTKEHGRRYGIDHKNKDALEPLVEVGKSEIAVYMRRNKMSLDAINSFLADKFDGRGADLKASNMSSFKGGKVKWANRKGC